MWSGVGFVLLVAYLPGAILFRLPYGRELRERLTAEERVFWYIILSLAFTSCAGLALAAAGWYRFDRLLWISAAVVIVPALVFRSQLRLGPTTHRRNAEKLIDHAQRAWVWEGPSKGPFTWGRPLRGRLDNVT